MNRRTGGPAQVKTDVVVALTTEQGRGVHGRAMFVVAPDRETVRGCPSLRTGPGEIVNPVRLIKDHRGVERLHLAGVHAEWFGRFYLRFRRSMKAWVGCGGFMLGSAVVVLAPSLLPGWALTSVLDLSLIHI